jgi:putative transposase
MEAGIIGRSVMPRIVLTLLDDLLQWLVRGMRSRTRLAAENLLLRKQLAFYVERRIKPRRLDDATRLTLGVLARFIEWRGLLTVVQPETLVRPHRQGFRLFWRWKSRRRRRPPIPEHLRALIAEMASASRTWGGNRIAVELLLKLGISVSPLTVRRYMKRLVRPVAA